MHNADSIFFPNSRHSTTGDKTFSLRSKMVPSIANNKHLGISYDDYLKPSLSPFGEVVAFFEASLSISFLGAPFLNFERKKWVWTSCIIKSTTIGADLVPSLRDTRGELKLTRGKYLAHPKNFTQVVAICLSIFRK